MYDYIAKDGSVIKMSDQAKFAMDKTIENNNKVRKEAKLQRKDRLGESIDRQLYELKGSTISMGKIPRK